MKLCGLPGADQILSVVLSTVYVSRAIVAALEEAWGCLVFGRCGRPLIRYHTGDISRFLVEPSP